MIPAKVNQPTKNSRILRNWCNPWKASATPAAVMGPSKMFVLNIPVCKVLGVVFFFFVEKTLIFRYNENKQFVAG